MLIADIVMYDNYEDDYGDFQLPSLKEIVLREDDKLIKSFSSCGAFTLWLRDNLKAEYVLPFDRSVMSYKGNYYLFAQTNNSCVFYSISKDALKQLFEFEIERVNTKISVLKDYKQGLKKNMLRLTK